MFEMQKNRDLAGPTAMSPCALMAFPPLPRLEILSFCSQVSVVQWPNHSFGYLVDCPNLSLPFPLFSFGNNVSFFFFFLFLLVVSLCHYPVLFFLSLIYVLPLFIVKEVKCFVLCLFRMYMRLMPVRMFHKNDKREGLKFWRDQLNWFSCIFCRTFLETLFKSRNTMQSWDHKYKTGLSLLILFSWWSWNTHLICSAVRI